MNYLSSSLLLPAIVFLPLLAAIIAFIIGRNRLQGLINISFSLTQFLLVVLTTLLFLDEQTDQSERYVIGGWGAPLGIDLIVDGFSILMLALTGLLTLLITLYSASYFSDKYNASEKSLRFWPLWWFLISGLNALFMSADAFNIYVCLEIIGLSAAALVALQGNRAALQAALRYLLVGLLGSLFYLFAIAILYRSHGTLDLMQIAETASHSFPDKVAMILITIGLLLKIALFPLHFWLPPAHANAPTPVSAILSALVVKASLYILIKFWFDVLGEATTFGASQVLGALGGTGIIYGSWCAFRATQLKLLIAYSTVAQLGYIFLLFPLSEYSMGVSSFTGSASQAAVYFIVAHACAKAAMFLAAGNLILAQGNGEIAKLKGIAVREPLNVLVFAIAGISLIGLPPSAGFIAKWLLLTTAFESGQWWWVIVVITGGLLGAMYLFKVLSLAFSTDPAVVESPTAKSTAPVSSVPVSSVMTTVALILALITLALGLNAEFILNISNTVTEVNGI
ncbi:oxidoreductase [Colwellia sp. MB02u-18]|uniref:complex I subunit 5 family protein n=1 Tax=unclassified Colwellia TaxID=196834 RepID=UPI0015F723D0|nr:MULTISPECIES: proton-conducting transporter membrane subunit [unclassified Colwellia]MBA6223018.1 oxidoreductase [Colwellia sp. MB3u-45]MBA6266187.1 oxidoreductase [Colwellia sp. MB3u-43]MBA6319663.1 oxidoreductase [Colwellia sp. MB02u-19]MBA6324271.1 oxidoreductase [Colwellia sp. MB02u-18]MBA6329957.1 oxidoreductase [Colwellia sp. MB02u-12]